jgi:hypothetical protein
MGESREPTASARSELAFRNSIYSLAVLLAEAGGKTKGVPFASITWSRFNGSAALPRSTLSLRAETGSATGRLPCNDLKLDRTRRGVKRGLQIDLWHGIRALRCRQAQRPARLLVTCYERVVHVMFRRGFEGCSKGIRRGFEEMMGFWALSSVQEHEASLLSSEGGLVFSPRRS